MYILSLFPKETLALASNLYAQSGLKHVLTQGDALLITLFADLPSQGIFALASNYGSLLARILFQPIEESSRSLLGRTLSVSPSKSSQAPSKENMRLVHTYLTTLLRFYSHLALLLLILAPPLSAPALSLLAGQIWRSSAAPRILSKYCRYLPLLAYNGLLEAFVSATASPAELRKQSIAMLVFSVVFAAAGYVLLGILGRGVDGILEANMCNMAIRIIWSRQWVEKWWTAARRAHKTDEKDALEVPVLRIFCAQTLPHPLTLAFAAGTWAVILQYPSAPDTWLRNSIGLQKSGGILDTLLDVAIIAVMGMPMLASITWSEWDTFVEPVINRFRSLVGIRYGGRAVEKEKKKTI